MPGRCPKGEYDKQNAWNDHIAEARKDRTSMDMPAIKGIHHITLVAANAQRTADFYTHVLGLRLVKKTVNFDAPDTYHLYFGDEAGTPGTLVTFFEWPRSPKGFWGDR